MFDMSSLPITGDSGSFTSTISPGGLTLPREAGLIGDRMGEVQRKVAVLRDQRRPRERRRFAERPRRRLGTTLDGSAATPG